MKKPINASSASSIVIVFGRTPESKVARGAKFRIEDREKALASARDRNFDLIMASDEETQRIAEELPEGRFAVNGRAQLPTIAPALYERLRTAAAKASDSIENLVSADAPSALTDAESSSAGDLATEEEMRSQATEPNPGVSTALASAAPDGEPSQSVEPADIGTGSDRHTAAAAEPNHGAAAQSVGDGATAGSTKSFPEADPTDPPGPANADDSEAATASAEETPGSAEETPGSAQAGVIAPAVIVFGRSGIGRPRAGWFPMIEAGLARKAAERQALSSLPIATPDDYRLASQIGRGKLFGHGLLTVPATILALFEKLLQLYERARSEGRTELTPDPEPTAPRLPTTWAEIGVGSLVLAPEEDDEGWWEAEVLAMAGDDLALRWLFDPQEPIFVRKLQQIALLSPDRPLAV